MIGFLTPVVVFLGVGPFSWADPSADHRGYTVWFRAAIVLSLAVLVACNYTYSRPMFLWRRKPRARTRLVEGEVHATEGTDTSRSGSVIARRVTGKVKHGDRVDDVWSEPFLVRDERGGFHRIDPGSAWFLLPADAPLVTPDDHVREALSERGLTWTPDSKLRTGVLREGARVRVSVHSTGDGRTPTDGPFRGTSDTIREGDGTEMYIEAT